MNIAAHSHIGKMRASNQDCCRVVQGKNCAVALVADGMGGHRGGEVASRLAATRALEHLARAKNIDEKAMLGAVRAANQAVYDAAKSDGTLAGMGTTLVVAALQGTQALIASVGDSRAYLYNAERGLRCITQDHSLVGDLVRRGELSPQQARKDSRRNIITRAVGTHSAVPVDLFEVEWSASDRLLLCSDGLTGAVEDAAIREVFDAREPAETAVQRLIDLALSAGGADNITVVIADNVGESGVRERE